MPPVKTSAVFLDRDGVLNDILFHQEMGLLETPFTIRQFRLKHGAARTVRRINRMGLKAVVVSNQPGVAMGHFSRRTLRGITGKMKRGLAAVGARIDAVYYCTHHPVKGRGKLKMNCRCRKPKPGLLHQAARELGLDLKTSYFIGDSITDVQAGRRAGVITLLLAHLKCDLCRLMARRKIKPHYRADNFQSAVRQIARLERLRKKT